MVTTGRFALSHSEKAEALADNLDTQFQPVTDPSVPVVIEIVGVALRSYFSSSASESQITTPDEVQAANKGLRVSNVPGQNGIPNTAMKHLPKRAVSFLAHVFNAVLRTHHFPQAWKHVRIISILKSGNDPALPSSYRPISLLDTIGKLFEKILLARMLNAVNESKLLRDKQFWFRLGHSTFLQLARLVEYPGISAKRGSPAQISSTWPKPSIPSGSMASSTN